MNDFVFCEKSLGIRLRDCSNVYRTCWLSVIQKVKTSDSHARSPKCDSLLVMWCEPRVKSVHAPDDRKVNKSTMLLVWDVHHACCVDTKTQHKYFRCRAHVWRLSYAKCTFSQKFKVKIQWISATFPARQKIRTPHCFLGSFGACMSIWKKWTFPLELVTKKHPLEVVT